MQRHLIGLLLGTEEDWPRAFEEIMRRLGPVAGPGGTRHAFDCERITIEPFAAARPAPLPPGHRPARLLVLRPARVAQEGRADGQGVPAEQPVHVPVDGEARGLLRDDAARAQGAGDRPGAVQEPGRQRPVRLHRGEVQPAVRPRRDRRADRLPAVHEALRRRRLARGVADRERRRAARGLRRQRRDAHAPAEGDRLRRLRPVAVDRGRDHGDEVPARSAHAPAVCGRPRVPVAAGTGPRS